MKKIYLIDVSSIFFRSFYAIRQLNNSKGIPTNAVYGFIVAIMKLLKEHKPDYIAFCYDVSGDGFREELYPEYKANRSAAPDDLIKQFCYLPRVAEAFSIAGFENPRYEADDIIGTLATLAKKHGQEVTIVSGDKDFGQLVEPGIRIFDPSKDLYMGDDEVRAKFGVNPNQVIDYLALVGDTSDNVPGVRGVGPKAAQKLLGEYGTLENVFNNLSEIKNDRLRELMSTQKEQALLSQKLVTIVRDIPLEYSEDIIKRRPPNQEKLVELLQELEFKTMLTKFLGEDAGQLAGSGNQVTQISIENSNLMSFENSYGASGDARKAVAITSDTNQNSPPSNLNFSRVDDVGILEKTFLKSLETNATLPLWCDSSPTGLAFALGENAFHFEGNIEKINNWLSDFLEKTKVGLAGFDTKGIAHQMSIKGSALHKISRDTMIAAHCLGHEGELDFKSLIKIHLEKDLPDLIGPAERLAFCQELSWKLETEGVKAGSNTILHQIELPLIPVLYRMESLGVLIDRDSLKSYSVELKAQIRNLEKEIFESVGQEFNIGSPKQLGQILFEKLKLPVIRKTKTGFSTDSDVLEKLKDQSPIAEKIIEWRELSKLNSTYVEALPQMINPETGRVHTRYNQAVTSTGRLSSVHPNLQNIPIRTPRGIRIRNSFVAPEGYKILSADYSQVELRILAHITGDKNLSRAFEQDLDIHSATASDVFGVALEDVNSDHRRTAKAINFGIVYGMSEFGLAENLSIGRKEAADFIQKYFERYPGVKEYMNSVVHEGMEKGYVETMFGRRRYYPGLKSSNRNIRQSAERQAINMPIQGAAADIIKVAMIKIDKEMAESNFKEKMIMQVHDELVFEVPDNETPEFQNQVKAWMGETTKLRVPLKVDVESGSHW